MEFALESTEAVSLYDDLRDEFPEFHEFMQSLEPMNMKEDGKLSSWGLWVEFGWWLTEHLESVSETSLERLGQYVSRCHLSNNWEVSNSASTCFLENMAGLPAAQRFGQYLSEEARFYMNNWQQPPNHSLQARRP